MKAKQSKLAREIFDNEINGRAIIRGIHDLYNYPLKFYYQCKDYSIRQI